MLYERGVRSSISFLACMCVCVCVPAVKCHLPNAIAVVAVVAVTVYKLLAKSVFVENMNRKNTFRCIHSRNLVCTTVIPLIIITRKKRSLNARKMVCTVHTEWHQTAA